MYFEERLQDLDDQIKNYGYESARLEKAVRKSVLDGYGEVGDYDINAYLRHRIQACHTAMVTKSSERQALIDKIIKSGSVSGADLIWLLKQYGYNYKVESFNGKTYLVPVETVFTQEEIDSEALNSLMSGALAPTNNSKFSTINSVSLEPRVIPTYVRTTTYDLYRKVKKTAAEKEAEIAALANQVEAPAPKKKSILQKLLGRNSKEENEQTLDQEPITVPDYKYIKLNQEPMLRSEIVDFGLNTANHKNLLCQKVKSEVALNTRLTDLVSAIEIDINHGVHIYKSAGNNIALNKDLLNIGDDRILGFLEALVYYRYANPNIELATAFKQYQAGIKPEVNFDSVEIPIEKSRIFRGEQSKFKEVRNLIRFYNTAIQDNPDITLLEVWTIFHDAIINSGFSEELTYTEELLKLFQPAEIDFMDFYITYKKDHPTAGYKEAVEALSNNSDLRKAS